MPEAASGAGEGTKIIIAPIVFFGEDFFDTFFGCSFGAEDYFTCGTAAAKFVVSRSKMTFVVHICIWILCLSKLRRQWS